MSEIWPAVSSGNRQRIPPPVRLTFDIEWIRTEYSNGDSTRIRVIGPPNTEDIREVLVAHGVDPAEGRMLRRDSGLSQVAPANIVWVRR